MVCFCVCLLRPFVLYFQKHSKQNKKKYIKFKEYMHLVVRMNWIGTDQEASNWESDVLYIYAHDTVADRTLCACFSSSFFCFFVLFNSISFSYAVVISVVVCALLLLASCTNAWRITMPVPLVRSLSISNCLLPSMFLVSSSRLNTLNMWCVYLNHIA